MKTIEGGILIDPANNIEGEFDLLIDGDKILAVDKPGSFSSKEVQERVDARSKLIVPGLIDLHVHLREPGFEWKETIQTGCEAAVLGGYTSICCMPNTNPTIHNAEVTRFILERAKEVALARVHPIGSVTIGLKGTEMSPLSELAKAGCVAFSDDGEPVWNSAMMRRALEWCKMLGVPICCHEEDKALSCGGSMNESPLSTKLGLRGWPKVAEEVMIARDIELARTTKSRVHFCHVTTARGTELIRRAKSDGINVTAEVTPHHLTLTEDSVIGYDTNAKMSPPLREEEDLIGLLEGVADGTLDVIASDHAPHEKDSKEVEFGKASFGILGLQTSLPLILDFINKGKVTKKRAFEVLSSSPAKIFRLNAGNLGKGKLADIAIIDPNVVWKFENEEIASISKNSPFIGKELKGKVDTVLVGGAIVVKDGCIIDRQ